MNSISFKSRIAVYFSISTALLVFIVFVVIYFTVRSAVYEDLDHDLDTEIKMLTAEIRVTGKGISVLGEEWKEKEHNTLDINPIFVQLITPEGNIIIKSPNLKKASLLFDVNNAEDRLHHNTFLGGAAVRQLGISVRYKGKNVGYIVVATPMEDARQLLENLQNTLAIAYPALLIVLFSVARLLAGKSIKPVQDITEASARIHKENLSSRIPLPLNKDELYTLSQTINDLLQRIENAVEREKQFTSDASHELRTPLAVIKGTLEVLIRKERSLKEYEEKINFCLTELDRINTMVDQLLLLARFESQKQLVKNEPVSINALLYDIAARHSKAITDKNLKIIYRLQKDLYITTDEHLLSIILENLVGNAVKYSVTNAAIELVAARKEDRLEILIEDSGIGIPENDLKKVFNPFFRSGAATRNNIAGTGIGLSIVKRVCELLDISINIESKAGKGTVVRLTV
ncbi:two-component sensor histidine kinase [Flavobacterium cyanobacteriorum]|uniref:histidine kinase n=1 Tax=Flavobacterium cyanobacteriorum TaxID=2022802 RepID=A0A255Z929_9FLAO|nr:ATP-binding protein [Flavobacterium cyanobacteriorum]OYQ38063.1 two-component sensor histidine kinase [Flavobacterium cyanobacteriorum]